MANPHVLVDMYRVEKVSFNETEIDYYVADVSLSGLVVGNNECPYGAVGYGETEVEARNDVREQLKECGFSKKQIEYRRVKL